MRLWFRRKGKKTPVESDDGAAQAFPEAPESPEGLDNQEIHEVSEDFPGEAEGSAFIEEEGAIKEDLVPETATPSSLESPLHQGMPAAMVVAEGGAVEPVQEAQEGLSAPKVGLFQRFRERLGRTREVFTDSLGRLFSRRREIDEELLEELEELLITADLGVETTLRLMEALRGKVRRRELQDVDRLKGALREEMVKLLTVAPPLEMTARPWVVLLVGVNGVGKTTTIAKLAHQDRLAGRRALLVAADTFRAAAVEQLEIWGQRVGVEVIKQKPGADPAAVVFDGLAAAQAREVDVVYIDTAGRLHTRVNLMAELKKIHRTAGKKIPGAPHEVLLILDATTGQNALSQARLFQEAVGVTGIILTKLDGTAKGGVILAVAQETGLPIRYVGLGEHLDDLKPFDPEAFVAAIFE